MFKTLTNDYFQLWFLYKSDLRISTTGKHKKNFGIKNFQA